ncbi:MAG: hypothetical protein LDL41_05320 [Coleofasciculus sp. S288]|nr:hypothetical protein [Coleofasciculus sp. S288]
MIDWNYRVFQEANGDYIIREVFYAEDGSILGCTEKAVEPWGRSQEELARDIESFKEALTLPVLTLTDIPTGSTKQKRRQKRSKNISHEQLMTELGLSHSSPSG